MYAITYVLVPLVAGVVAVLGCIGGARSTGSRRKLAINKGLLGSALLVCTVLNSIDFVEVADQLNLLGWILFPTIVATQLALGVLAALESATIAAPSLVARVATIRATLAPAERWLGAVSIGTGVAMALVRGQIFITIF